MLGYLDGSRDHAIREGYVASVSGRRRYIPEINAPNPARRQAAERMAINMPVQGTAADLMKEAMIRIHAALRDEGLLSKLLLQVHDELVFEAPVSELQALCKLAQRVMRGVGEDAGLIVPLEVEVKAGQNWEQLQPV